MNSPNEFEYLYKVFNLEKVEPNPPLPPCFSALIQAIDVSILKSSNKNEDNIRNSLKLNFIDRFPSLSMIIENKQKLTASEQNTMFTIQYILQSISPPFLNSLNVFDADFLIYLVHLLSFTFKLINSTDLEAIKNIKQISNSNELINSPSEASTSSELQNHTQISLSSSHSTHSLSFSHSSTFISQSSKYNQLLQQSFYFLYEKIIAHPQLYQIFPSITRLLQKLQNFSLIQSDIVPTTPIYFSELHIKSCIKLLDFIKQYRNSITLLMVTNQLKLILYFFNENYLNKNQRDQSLGKSSIPEIYEQALYTLNTLSQSIDIPDTFRYLLISLCLSFDLITGIEFKQIIEILTPMISNPPIISKEEIEMKGKPYETLIIKTPEELISEKDDDDPITIDSYSFPALKSIDSYLSSIHHPLQIFIENISSFSEELHFVLIKLIAYYGVERIVNQNDANFQILLFILLRNLSGNVERASAIFESKKNSSLFFTKCLFNPAVTIFNYPDSPMIKSRFLVIPIFKVLILNSTNSSFYLNALLNFLNALLKYPEMFSEFFFFTFSIYTHYFNEPNEFQQVIVNCATQTLLFQQTAKLDGAQHQREFRALTFQSLQQIIDSIHHPIPLSELFDNLLLLLFEKCVSVVSYQILEKYILLFKSTDENTLKEIIHKLTNNISICKTNLKLFNPVLEKLLNVIFTFTKSLTGPLLQLIQKTSFFDDIRNLIFLDDISINSIAASLKIVHISSETEVDLPFQEFANIISKYEMTEQMVEAAEICLSHNTDPFIGIANENAIPLILPILHSEKFQIIFLKKLYDIISTSIPDCIIIAKTGLMANIIEIINEDSSNELFELAMKIFTAVSPHITDRRIVLSFLRLTSPIISNRDNKISYRQSKYASPILDLLLSLVLKRPISFRTILRITPLKGTITDLPPLSPKNFPDGFTFSFLMLVTNFHRTSDKLQLFKLHSASADKYLTCYLLQDQIVFPVSQKRGYAIPIQYKMNQWFQISISFRKWEMISARINGKPQGNTGVAFTEWIEPFTDNCLFGFGTGFVECQLAKFAIFENSPNIEEDFDLIRNTEISNKAIFLLDSQSYTFDAFTNKIKMYNISNRTQFTILYNFDGTLFTNISTFSSTFLYSKGISFILSMFAQITLDFTQEELDQSVPASFFLRMLELICILIQINESTQQELAELNGFQIIAHFLFTAIKKKNIQMNWPVTLGLLKIFTFLKNDELRISFIRSVLLNFTLWKDASFNVLIELFKAWLISAQSTPMVILTRLRPEVIIIIIKKLTISDKNTAELLDILFDILQKSMLFQITREDIVSYTELMKLKKDSTSYLKELLIKLSTFVKLSPNSQDLVGSVLLTTDWLISDYNDIEIQKMLISNFANLNLNLLSILFLKNLELASKRSETENDKLLLFLCSHFVGVEIDQSNQHKCSQILLELIDKSKEWDLNEMLLPICLSVAFYCSDEVSQNFSLFMYNVFSSHKRLVQISSIIKLPTLLFMLSFAIFKTPTVIDFLTVLIISNPAFCSSCFHMIDLITSVLDCDLHDFQHLLTAKIITEIFEHDFDLPKQPYLDMIIDFISFRVPNAKYDCKLDQVTFTDLLLKFQNKESITISDVSLRFQLDANGNWEDWDLIMQLLHSLPNQYRNSLNGNSLDLSRFMVLLSFACHKNIHQSQPEFFVCLDSLTELIPADSPLWNPIIYQVSRHPHDFEQANLFTKIFQSKVKALSIDLFVDSEKMVKAFTPKIFDIPENIIGIVHLMNTYKLTSHSETFELNDDPLNQLLKIDDCFLVIYQKYWHKLLKTLIYEQSPYSTYETRSILKRGNYYNILFCPSINTKLELQNLEVPVSTITDKQEFEQTVVEYGYSLSTLKSPTGLDKHLVCAIDCQRIKGDKFVDGRLFLLDDTLKFISKSLKILVINAIDIHAIFFFESTFQLYLKNYHGYMFKFDNNDESRFISNLQKTKFSDEINKNIHSNSNITEKWLKFDLSNFDYLILVNLLNGRSFLSSNYYPLLPNFDDQMNIQMESTNSNKPEKYFDLTNNSKLVYKNRRILEEEKTSINLHEWISSVFHEKNPPRKEVRNLTENIDDKITINNFSSQVIDFYTTGTDYSNSKILALLKNGKIFLYSIDTKQTNHDYSLKNQSLLVDKKNAKRRKTLSSISTSIWLDSTILDAKLKSLIIGNINNNINFVTFMNNKFFYVFGDTIGIFDFSFNTTNTNNKCNEIKSDAIVSPISALDSFGNTVVTGSEDGSITLWDATENIPKFKDVLILRNAKSIAAIAVSELFGLVVSCDIQGQIFTARITDLRLLNRTTLYDSVQTDLNAVPLKIQITNGLGFIICLTMQNEIIVLTTSLEKVNQKKFDDEIIDFCALPSQSGLDTFAVANNHGKIFIYNAFTMEQEMFVCTEKSAIQKIKYCAEIHSFVLSMADSPLVIIPFEL